MPRHKLLFIRHVRVILVGFLLAWVPATSGNIAVADEKNEWFFKSLEFSSHDYMQRLLAEGADVNARDKYGSTPLVKVSCKGDHEKAAMLIEKGADVNAQGPGGMTALMSASSCRVPGVVKLLLDSKADVNARDKRGMTPLIWACTGSFKDSRCRPLASTRISQAAEVVKLLLESGADVNSKSATGKTALMGASLNAEDQLVVLILERGAEVNAKDNEGQSALNLVMNRNVPRFQRVKELLLQHGAKD
jgi:ankyrin repeat protein